MSAILKNGSHGYRPKLLKFSLFSSRNARASLRITFLANSYWHIWLWPTIFTYLGNKWCVILPKNPLNFTKNYPRKQWFCVVCCSVKTLLRVVSNVWGHQCKSWWQSSKSEGCVSIKRQGHQFCQRSETPEPAQTVRRGFPQTTCIMTHTFSSPNTL